MKKWSWILLADFILLMLIFISRVNYKKEKLFKDEGKAVLLPIEKNPENLPPLEPFKVSLPSGLEKQAGAENKVIPPLDTTLPPLEPRLSQEEQKEREALGIMPSREELRELEKKNIMLN